MSAGASDTERSVAGGGLVVVVILGLYPTVTRLVMAFRRPARKFATGSPASVSRPERAH